MGKGMGKGKLKRALEYGQWYGIRVREKDKGMGLLERGIGKAVASVLDKGKGQEHGKCGWERAWNRDIGKGMSCGKDMG